MFASMLLVCPLCLYAQNSDFNFDSAFEKTAQLIVMLKADYGETQKSGAGIVFGREKNRLLIATAYHIFKGAEQTKDIGVQFRSMPGNKYITAKLLRHDEEESLDVAILSVENLKEQSIDVCSMPFDRLGKVYKIKRGDMVYAVGNPNGVSWAMPVAADRISQVNGDLIDFQSNFISEGHSGGGLLDENANLIGMTIADAQPFGKAIILSAILQKVKKWGYTTQLDTLLPGKWTPLHMAANKGDIAAIKFHLTDCGDPNTVDAHNATPLHWAAASGSVEALSILLKAGAYPNILDNDGDLPLEWAIEKGCFECVKILVNAGTKLNTQNNKGQTVLHIAIVSGQEDIALLLIKSNADLNKPDEYGGTPLYYAIATKQLRVIEAILNSGVRYDNYEGPILIAIDNNFPEAIELFSKYDKNMNAGISISKTNFYHFDTPPRKLTFLEYAITRYYDYDYLSVEVDRIKSIETLIASGSSVNNISASTYSPLTFAINEFYSTISTSTELNKCLDLLKLLLKKGAKINLQDENGNTALHLALAVNDNSLRYEIEDFRLALVKFLLEAGANPNLKNKEGQTSLRKAHRYYGLYDSRINKMIELLKKYGAKDD